MKLKQKEDQLIIETKVYQARNGAIWLDWGNTGIRLDKDYTHNVAYEIPDFDIDAYKNFYMIK